MYASSPIVYMFSRCASCKGFYYLKTHAQKNKIYYIHNI